MSNLLEQIKVDQLTARKAADTIKASILTTLLGEASPSGKETVTDAQVEAVITKFVKNLNETMPYLSSVDKRNAATQEIAILKEYLPDQIEGRELEKLIFELVNADGCDNMGQVMKALNSEYKGRFDGKEASNIAKKLF